MWACVASAAISILMFALYFLAYYFYCKGRLEKLKMEQLENEEALIKYRETEAAA